MKKIQKVNRTSAQSVFSFYCPCSGSCSTDCDCNLFFNDHFTNLNNKLQANNPQATTLV
jgi:putative bacteriocin precursor